ncbi:MAG: hypothetical protein CMN28_15025 [Salinisphaeraceae bacterium]|nr:hypothetical protein [Salinisphaeraceae bacterium]
MVLPIRTLAEIYSFELDVARGHLADIETRMTAAMESRSPAALLREQYDLMPESWRRVRRNIVNRGVLITQLLAWPMIDRTAV